MNQIKFSHKYDKFEGIDVVPDDVAMLIQCVKIHHDDLSSSFKNYDTAWTHNGVTDFYILPKIELILLIFRHNATKRIFTTLRPYIDKKYIYYKSNEGNNFRIVLNEEAE